MHKLFTWLGTILHKIMHTPQVNSRLVFLAHSMTAVVGTLVLVVAFVITHDKTGYDTMLLALNGGSGIGGAIGRYFTKKGDQGGDAEVAPDPTQEEK